MRKSLLVVLAALLTVPVFAQFQGPAPSPHATVMQRVGITDVTITYSRPGVKGRVIWGELVPYEQVWRTGANAPTRLELSGDVKINGHELKAGTYSIHTIPTKGDWTIIINSSAQTSGYSYDEKLDVLRFQVTPKQHDFHERMTFVFPEVDDDSASVALAWEKLMIPFEIETDTKTQVIENAKSTLDNWVPLYQAANYAFNNGMAEDAARWNDRSMGIRETYQNTSLEARMLAESGMKNEAIAMAKKAVEIGKEAGNNTAATEKLIEEWSQ